MKAEEKFSWKMVFNKMHLITVAIIFLLDQATKYAVIHFIPLGTYIEITSFFNLVHTKNKGAAFSMFADAAPAFRLIFFGLVSIVCLYLLLHWLGTTAKKDWWQRLALSLIFGGALGNLKDRVVFQQVTDFLDFHYKDAYHFAAFNIADSAITVGVGLLLIQFILPSVRKYQRKA